MGQDARVRYTKMIIEQSFLELLKDNPLNRITVKKICEIAQVNRSTFYKYYLDPYDLFDKIKQKIIEQLNEYLKDMETESTRDFILKTLDKFKTDFEVFNIICSENGDNRFPVEIFYTCYSYISPKLPMLFPSLSEHQQKWLYYYITTGCGAVLGYWFTSGMKESPEEMCDFVEQLVKNTLAKK